MRLTFGFMEITETSLADVLVMPYSVIDSLIVLDLFEVLQFFWNERDLLE